VNSQRTYDAKSAVINGQQNNHLGNSAPLKPSVRAYNPVPEMVLICIARSLAFLVYRQAGLLEAQMTTANTRSITTNHSANTRIASDNGTSLALIPFFQVSIKVGIGRSRIYALIGEGNFPPPVKIGASSRWLVSEIDAYIAQLAATRNSNLTGA
jgi:prophage regulatory protein